MSSWTVVGIGGVTCGGKTTISNHLHKLIPNSVIIHQDDYFHPMSSDVLEYIEEVSHYNWDTVTAINSERLINDVKKIISNSVTNGPRVLILEGHFIYHFLSLSDRCDYKFLVKLDKEISRCRRLTRKYKRYDQRYFDQYAWPSSEHHYKQAFQTSENGGVLLVEGTLVLNIAELCHLCNLKYYLTLPYAVSKQRRSQKNYEIPDPPFNFDKIVWPSYLIHKQQLEQLNLWIKFVDTFNNDLAVVVRDIMDDLSVFCSVDTVSSNS